MAHNKDIARKRMNALANQMMKDDGLDPVKDQKRRPAYVERARAELDEPSLKKEAPRRGA